MSGFVVRKIRVPDAWTSMDEKVHAGCEYADESTMPALPQLNDAEAMERWANDLAATHATGDLARMVFHLLAVDARLPSVTRYLEGETGCAYVMPNTSDRRYGQTRPDLPR